MWTCIPIETARFVWPFASQAGRQLIAKLPPEFWHDPAAQVVRIADAVVWKGTNGQRVIAALESAGETQQRINAAVTGIESTQLAMSGVLNSIQQLSMATFGLTSLSAGLMLWRLSALNKRCEQLGRQIRDLEAHHEAQEKSELLMGLQFFREYEEKQEPSSLEKAVDHAVKAAFTYEQLVGNELNGAKRIPVLNYRGRCYLLALTTELQCNVLRGNVGKVFDERTDSQRPLLREMVQTTFQETVGRAPEVYLSPELADSGVTLALMTELYQQLQQAGALKDVDIRDASSLFEHLRAPIFQTRTRLRRYWAPLGKAKQRFVQNLKYLIACVEDTNRIESLRLMVSESREGRFDFQKVRDQIRAWRDDHKGQADSANRAVLAYNLL